MGQGIGTLESFSQGCGLIKGMLHKHQYYYATQMGWKAERVVLEVRRLFSVMLCEVTKPGFRLCQ